METKDKPTKIEFFYLGESIGTTFVKMRSAQADRVAAALSIGINTFDRFILDDGRVDASLVENRSFIDAEGRTWLFTNNEIHEDKG